MEKKKIVAFINAVKKTREVITDDQALEAPDLFPEWKEDGHEYQAGDRCMYNGKLYKVLQAHTSQAAWNPAAAVSLFAEVLPGQGGDIGEWVQPDSTNPYMKGDKVTHNGKTWESTVDNNVWEPGVYGWQEVE
jgi:chitodextrinase